MHGIERPLSVVAIGGSAGSVPALLAILSALPADLPAAVIVATHLAPRARHASELPRVLQRVSRLPVRWARSATRIAMGAIVVAPQDCNTMVDETGRLCVVLNPAKPRPRIDLLYESVAAYAGRKSIAVVLSGTLNDGARGALAIEDAGGVVIAQDRSSSEHFSMPAAAIATRAVHHVLPVNRIAQAVMALLGTGVRAWFAVHRGSAYQASASA